jgi:hypothetical protein
VGEVRGGRVSEGVMSRIPFRACWFADAMRFRVVATSAVAALLAFSARGDAVADLRATLAKLAGRDSLHASFDITRSRHANGRFLTENFQGSASIEVDGDANGVRITVPRATVDRATDERAAHAIDPQRSAPTSSVLEEVIPLSAANAINSAHPLLHLLQRGALIEQRSEAFQGKQARVLVLRLPKSSGSSADGAVSVEDDRLTIWMSSDNMPLAAERVRKGKVGIMLLHADTLRREQWTYVVRGDHLCTARLEDRSTVSGLGQNGDAATVWVMRG